MEASFENKKFRVEFLEDNVEYKFNVKIKHFDVESFTLVYYLNENSIIDAHINNENNENGPKDHVAYKMLSLIEYEVKEVMDFLILHN